MKTRAFVHEAHVHIGGLLKEAVFGFNDGLVSTFAVIAGLTGGATEQRTILLAALATLFAGAFSMGLGTYLGSKSEKDLYESEKKRELYEMEHMPDVERQEIYEIYEKKGFKGKLLQEIVKHITNDDKLWLDTMMREELGFAGKPPKPGLNGVIMSGAFIVGALIPTLPYIFSRSFIVIENFSPLFSASLILAITGLLAAGAYKTRFTKGSPISSALETLLIGALAASGSYGIGIFLT